MAEVAAAFVSIAPSAKGFGRKLSSEVDPQLDKSGKAGGRRFGKAFGTAAKAASLAFVAGGVLLLKGAVSAASDLSESVNAVSVSYGKASKDVLALGKNSATAFGLSKSEFNGFAVQFQSFAKTIAGKGGDVAKSLESVIGRATDFASVMNLEVADAAQLFQSGLAGETEPLRKYGIDLSAAAVEAYALSEGIVENKKDLTESAKVQARYGLLMKQTSKAQGDFANTSDGLANKQRILAARTEDLKAKIGEALLPAVTKVATFLADKAVPAISDFIEGMEDGTGAGGEVADALKDVYNAGKPIAKTIENIVKSFAGLPGGTQKVILLAAAALLLKNRFAGSLPTMQNFDKTAALATAKTVALRGGALAAAGGLAALASKAGGTNTELGALATVGASVAAGFAVGGPVGAALGAGAAALSIFSSRSAAAAAKQQALDSAAQAVAATLNEQTGALTATTRATAAKELADTGAFAAAQKVGVSLETVLDAALGNAAAQDTVAAATRAYMDANSESFETTLKAAKNAGILTSAVYGTSGALSDQRNKISQVNDAMGKGKDKTVTYQVNTPGLVGTIGRIAALGAAIDSAVAKSNKANIGANAKGTDNWRGGLTVVGEKGPELINLQRGAQVIPNHKIGSMAGGAVSSAAPGPVDLSPDSIARLAGAILAGAHSVAQGVSDRTTFENATKSRLPGAYVGSDL